ncbi:MAG: alpha/beta fold hydrolase [Acetobacteraceae bacterium]|nr:alpha/beta fold hydrolase [Acetobacteraceae bacterium]
MAALSAGRRVSAWDGLPLLVHDWGVPSRLPALLCLPGLVRTGGDFAELAARHGPARRVVSLDYAGRGGSGRARDVARYAPEACLRDLLDVCAALHLHRVVAVGTSMGGLLAMGLAAARPGLLAGVVLNDIGPEIGTQGMAAIRHHVADDPALPDLAAAAAHLRTRLPDLSLDGEAAWQRFAALTYAPGADGRLHPRWDTAIAGLLGRAVPPLWPLFGALAGMDVLLVHGLRSRVLTAETVARMRAARPDMIYAPIEACGHAPTLGEPAACAALDGFLTR